MSSGSVVAALFALWLLGRAAAAKSSGTAKLTKEQIRGIAQLAGFPEPNVAAAIALAESGGNPSIIGDPQYGGSVGLWQINLPSHPEWTREQLQDPNTNASAAYAISKGGHDWTPWTTYRTGAYRKYL